MNSISRACVQQSKLLLNSIMVKISEWLQWLHFNKTESYHNPIFCINYFTYIISILESAGHGGVHVMMIQSHESCVNHNAKSYKEINKWIEDNKGEELCQLDVTAAAVPDTHDLHQLHTERVQPLLQSEIMSVNNQIYDGWVVVV